MSVADSPSKIQILPENVSSQIAAGEVVDRPASIVKELLDNSLDAGSTFISVEVEDGGKELIRVTDDGAGMSRVEAQIACRRFATSKLRTESDLFRIGTFGFRGEALPSIASVSRLSLVTMCRESSVGTCLRVEAGTILEPEDRAASVGTRIEVANLFFNTPGRKKFLKSTVTEFSHISRIVQQAALASPHTHFRLGHHGRKVLDYGAVGTFTDRVLQVFGAKFMNGMLPIEGALGGCSVYGVVVNPYHARTSRSPQEVFVNRRPVRNTTVLHAVYEAYASFLPKGRHPIFVLLLTIPPDEVDVNVHPAKREVKFSSPDIVHRLIKDSVRRLLQQKDINLTVAQTADPDMSREQNIETVGVDFSESAHHVRQDERTVDVQRFPEAQHENLWLPKNRSGQFSGVSDPACGYGLPGEQQVQVLGQVSRTYIVAQVGEELHVLDQHTIHERVLFERLWRAWKERSLPSQNLLIPEPIDVPAPEREMLNEYVEELRGLGLEIEPFGSTAFIIRAVPAWLGQMDYAALISDLIDDLSEWKSVHSLEERVRPVLASMACQGAVQAGRQMTQPEMKSVVDDWIAEGVPMTCPHGRRVSMHFSTNELHKIFRRL